MSNLKEKLKIIKEIQTEGKKDISNLDLSRITLKSELLNGIIAQNTNFSNTNLTNIYFEGIPINHIPPSIFSNANFSNATLFSVNCKGCKMDSVNFNNAVLHGVNFENTVLTNAIFSNIQTLKFLNCKGADLTGANFENTNIEQALVDGHLEIDEYTKTDNVLIKRFQKGDKYRNDYDSRRIKEPEVVKEFIDENECPVCLDKLIRKNNTDVVLLHSIKGKPHIIHTNDFIQLKPLSPGFVSCPICREPIRRPYEDEDDIPIFDYDLDKEIVNDFELNKKRNHSMSSSISSSTPSSMEYSPKRQNWQDWQDPYSSQGGKRNTRITRKYRKSKKSKKNYKKIKRKSIKK